MESTESQPPSAETLAEVAQAKAREGRALAKGRKAIDLARATQAKLKTALAANAQLEQRALAAEKAAAEAEARIEAAEKAAADAEARAEAAESRVLLALEQAQAADGKLEIEGRLRRLRAGSGRRRSA